MTPDLHWMWQRITKAGEGLEGEEKKKAILEEIGKIRNTVNAIKAVGMDAYKIYTPLLNATNFNENGLLRHEVINKLYEAKRTLLETRYTGIVSSG